MALSINPATKVITIPQADLTLITGTLYELDTNQFRKDVMALLDDEDYIWMDNAFNHNTEVTIAGTTFARTLEFVNGYSIEFENGSYSVRLAGSNNNIFDVENGILVQNTVQVIAQNSAGLINAGSTSPATIAAAVWDETEAELSSLPGATPSFRLMVRYLYQFFRFKKTATATEEKMFKDDTTTVLGTSTLSDDGTTFTRGEMN